MSRRTVGIVALLGALAVPVSAWAQEEEAERPFVYSTYYYCDVADQELADMLVESVHAPIYDAAVEDGTIQAWGWLSHHTGGKWRRALYYIAPTTDALLAAQKTLAERVDESSSQADARFTRICGAHDDYIWRSVAGSGEAGVVDTASGDVGISQYMVCKMSKHERADEIVESVFGPIYDAQVEAGDLVGWGWLEHQVGGKYRRVFTLRGEDHSGLLDTWGAAINALNEKHADEMDEFGEICYTHQDYMWDIVH